MMGICRNQFLCMLPILALFLFSCTEENGDDEKHYGMDDRLLIDAARASWIHTVLKLEHLKDIDPGLVDNSDLIDRFSKVEIDLLRDSGSYSSDRLIDQHGNDFYLWLSSDKQVLSVASAGLNELWENGDGDDLVRWYYIEDSSRREVSEEDKFPLIGER